MRPKKKKRDDITNEVLTSVRDHFKKPPQQEDRYDYYAKTVAAKLRGLGKHQALIAEKMINDILFEAELRNLSQPSRDQSSVSHHNSPPYSSSPSPSASPHPSSQIHPYASPNYSYQPHHHTQPYSTAQNVKRSAPFSHQPTSQPSNDNHHITDLDDPDSVAGYLSSFTGK